MFVRHSMCIAALATTACGSGDGTPDASPADLVRVTVYEAGAPAPGVLVWFSDGETGELILEGATNEGGAFSAVVPPGSSVSAAIPEAGSDPPHWTVHSILRTQAGDDLSMGWRESSDATIVGLIDVDLAGLVAGAVSYEVSVGCSPTQVFDPSATVTIPLLSYCKTADDRVVVLARALDDLRQLIAYALAIVDAPVSGGTTSIDLGAWRTDFSSFAVTLDNLPQGVHTVHSDLRWLHDEVVFPMGQAELRNPVAASAFAQVYSYPPDLGTTLTWTGVVVYPSAGPDPDGAQIVVRSVHTPPFPEGAVFDFTTDATVPRLSSAIGAIAANGSPELHWTGDASGAGGIFAAASWENPNRSSLHWRVVSPAGSETGVAFPELPPALEDIRGVLAYEVVPAIYAVDVDIADDYDTFRRRSDEVLNIVLGTSRPTYLRLDVGVAGFGL